MTSTNQESSFSASPTRVRTSPRTLIATALSAFVLGVSAGMSATTTSGFLYAFRATTLLETEAALALDSTRMSANASFVTPPPERVASNSTSGAPSSGAVVYSWARRDRSGSGIIDMLMAHAYAFKHNMTYMGACENSMMTKESKGYVKTRKYVISAIGLASVLPFACPNNTSQILGEKVYRKTMREAWTGEWLQLIRSHVKFKDGGNGGQRDYNYTGRPPQVSMHVRRGDVHPCGVVPERYLSNSHYLALLKKYTPPNANVTIHSNRQSFEAWSDFESLNYTLDLDTDIINVWKAMIKADYVITSISEFSLVPAMLNAHGKVIYTHYGIGGLEDWIIVRQAEGTQKQREHWRKKYCVNKTRMSHTERQRVVRAYPSEE
jgi:hypothetical protein